MKKSSVFGALIAVFAISSATATEATLLGSIQVGEDGLNMVDASGALVSNGITFSTNPANNSVTYDASAQTFTTDGSSTVVLHTTNLTSMADSFSISFTADWDTAGKNWPNLFSFGENSGSWTYKIYATKNDGYAWDLAGNSYASNITKDYTTTATGGLHDYIFSLSTANRVDNGGSYGTTGDRTYTLYEDGDVVFQFSDAGQQYGNPSNMWFSFGGSMQQDEKAPATFSNVKFYSGTLTPSSAIPEPTTATLSLLALAGLAARRRRK